MQRLKYCLYDAETKILTNEKPPVPVTETSIASFLLRSFDEHGDKIFHTDFLTSKSWTFRQVKNDSLRLASSLINHLHLKEGDFAFGYAPTSSMFARTVYACILAGVTFTGELQRLSSVSLVPLIQECNAKVIITAGSCLQRVTPSLKECPSVETVILVDASTDKSSVHGVKFISVGELIAHGSLDDKNVPRIPKNLKEHVVFMPYSSGSTGRQKGVKFTAHSVLASCLNGVLGVPSSTWACWETLGHVSGQISLMITLMKGVHGIMIPGFTIENLLQAVSKFKVNASLIPPTLIGPMAKMTLEPKLDLSSLKFVVCGGAALSATAAHQFLVKFPSVVKLTNTYGLSEGGMATRTPVDCTNYNSIGTVNRGVELKIVNRQTGVACSFKEVGEIWLRSEMSAIGYLNQPDAQAEMWSADGWLKTGDAAYYDEDGLIFVVDRYKEMIKVHSNQVAPAELEALLCLHPDVSEACVVPTAHPVTGETPRAFVVPRSTVCLPDEDDILKFVNEQVIDLRQIQGGLFLVESLPKVMVGKLDRKFVKKQYDQLIYLRPNSRPN